MSQGLRIGERSGKDFLLVRRFLLLNDLFYFSRGLETGLGSLKLDVANILKYDGNINIKSRSLALNDKRKEYKKYCNG